MSNYFGLIFAIHLVSHLVYYLASGEYKNII